MQQIWGMGWLLLSCTEIRWLTQPVEDIPPLHPEMLFSVFGCMFRIIVLLKDEIFSNDLWCLELNLSRMLLNTSSFILLLPSKVKSSLNSSVPVQLAAIHDQDIIEPPPCSTDVEVTLGIELFLFSPNFPSLHHYDRDWFLFNQSIELCSRALQVHLCMFFVM